MKGTNMRLVLALVVTLSVVGVAYSQQLRALPIKSYVLTDPDGTPRYLVQYSDDLKIRKMFYVKPIEQVEEVEPIEPQNSNPPQYRESNRRSAPAKRFVWPNEWM
jgi:hypothetical protein